MIPEGLTEHIRLAAGAPFVWGQLDCCLWPADWILRRRGMDPAAPLRGRYRTAIGAMRHIRRLGGFEPMVVGLMSTAGLSPTTAPIAGDVGFVEIPEQGGVMAIRTSRGWACKAPRGIVVAPFTHRLAWSV